MKRHVTGGVAYYTFDLLDAHPSVVHGITTRHGGVSEGPWASLNLTKGTGDDPESVEENLRRTSRAFGFLREELVSPNQQHTTNARRVGWHDRGRVFTCTDTLLTADAGVPLLLRFADCTPVLLYDPVQAAIAVVHSGWRGTVQAASAVAVHEMELQFGTRPAHIVAAIGPSIGPCCYEIGPEVEEAVRGAFSHPDALLPDGRNARRHFDLWAGNRHWLHEVGVRQIEIAEICTACHSDEFFSYRAQHGRTGHFGAVMALRSNRG